MEAALNPSLGATTSTLARSHHHRKAKAHKVLEGKLQFVMGHDVFMERVEALCSQELIGRLEYCQMGKKEWVSWALEHWKPFLSYVPMISLLARGWIVFVFLEDSHATTILNSLWRIGGGSLVLDRWHVNFDPLRERVKKRHLWVFLLALPFPL